MSSKVLELPAPVEDVVQGKVDKEDRDEESTYRDPPMSQCKGRKKMPAHFKSIVEVIARQQECAAIVTLKRLTTLEHVPSAYKILPRERICKMEMKLSIVIL